MCDKSIEGGESKESVNIREILSIGGFEVKFVPELLIKKSAKHSLKEGLSELLFESFDEESVLKVERVDDFDGREDFNSRYRSKISQVFNKLTKVKLSSIIIVAGESYFVGAVFKYRYRVLSCCLPTVSSHCVSVFRPGVR